MGGLLSFAIGALTLAAIGLVGAIVLSNRFLPAAKDAPATTVEASPTDADYVDVRDLPESEMVLKADSFSDDFLPGKVIETPSPEPEEEPTSTPAPMQTLEAEGSAAGALRPTPAAEGMLPVFKKANTNERVIAITLDECSDLKLMQSFIGLARHYGAKLTLFPTGENIMKSGMGTLLKSCLLSEGYEIENRGYSELARVYQYVDSLMVQEIWKQSVALNFVLGVKYQPHFYRMYGGLGENDPRTHAYLKQQGYLGIAHWTTSCTGMDVEDIPSKLTPGGIYAFRCSQEDGQRMYTLMAAAKKAGYRMVTMNQLFGYPANETTKVQGSLLAETLPAFTYDTSEYTTLVPGDCCWAVARLQQRLADLGYLPEGSSDGMFGEKTSIALRAFQTQISVAASGAADIATQQRLFATDAPKCETPLTELFREEDGNPFADSGDEDNPFGEPEDEPGDDGEDGGDEADKGDAPEESEAKPKKYPMLRRGARGDAVKQLQRALIEAGVLEGEADGRYGKATADAVKALQKTWDYKANGMAGPKFQAQLFEEYPLSDEDEDEPEEADGDEAGEAGDAEAEEETEAEAGEEAGDEDEE